MLVTVYNWGMLLGPWPRSPFYFGLLPPPLLYLLFLYSPHCPISLFHLLIIYSPLFWLSISSKVLLALKWFTLINVALPKGYITINAARGVR